VERAPTAVTVVAVLLICLSGCGFLVLPVFLFETGNVGPVEVGFTIAVMVLSPLFFLWCGVGMLRRRRAAYVAYLGSIPVCMVTGLVWLVALPAVRTGGKGVLANASFAASPWPLWAIIVWVLTRPAVRAWFRKPGDRAWEETP
jgi:hypothetical protein